ncbi:A/G-specific adenine glycosylase [Puniceicoccaceae bacterium K14]|nr:A/G-specific adenine glycosylase [Puniceicoccaceae bacterium K14]
MPSDLLVQKRQKFQENLINWYDANARDLPWREKPSVYKTVVSEFMLQQTQVKTVLPYFDAWLKNYPNFSELAAATEDQVLKSWEGLGYYSRARNLHKLAKAIIKLEEMPTDSKNWQAFPGIGPYAAAAVCSISFNDPSAVVDGNVVRILSRLTADENEYKSSTDAAKVYRQLSQDLLNLDRAGDHNQAMMELGATLCHKQKPQCLLCPVNELCQGSQQGIAEELPKLNKIKIEKKTVDRAWIQNEKGILLYKIPQNASRMKGLHEIPTLEQAKISNVADSPILERKRSITKYRITERFFDIEQTLHPTKLPENCIWTNPQDLKTLAFSGPHRRWIEELIQIVP